MKVTLFFLGILCGQVSYAATDARQSSAPQTFGSPAVGPSGSAATAAEAPAGLSDAQAVTAGLNGNLDLLAAKYNISLAEADELTAGLWPNPSLLIDAGLQPFGHNWNQTSAGGPKQNDIVLSFPLDFSGKIAWGKKSAHAAVDVAQAQFQDAIRLKILDIRLAYIEVITQEAQMNLDQEKAESLGRLVKVLQQRIGAGGRLPLLQTRAELAMAQAQLDKQQRQIQLRAAQVQLAIQLGRALEGADIRATSSLRDFSYLPTLSKDKLFAMAEEKRPDLKAIQLSLTKFDADARLARAQVWDNFTLTGGLTRQGPTSANPGDPNSVIQGAALAWSAGLTIPLPVFNRSQGLIAKADFGTEQARRQLSAKNLAISQEIDGLVDQIVLGRTQIESYESYQLKRARTVRDNQQRLFGTGANALLDYFDAIAAYQGTLSSYYDTVAEYRRNMARLQAAAGQEHLQ